MNIFTRAARLVRDRNFVLFLANFGVGKGLAFFGPILLATLLAPRVYGMLEFALAVGQIGGLILTAGVPAAFMQIALMRIGRRVMDLLASAAAIGGGLALAAAALAAFFGAEAKWILCAVFSCLSVMQQSWAAYARAFNRRNFNVWIDHIPTVAAVAIALMVTPFSKGDTTGPLAAATWILSGVGVGISAYIAWKNIGDGFLSRLREAIVIGVPIIGASVLSAWLVSSGRVYIGLLLGDDDVYAYAFTFRVSAVLVMLHALVITAFAAQLYKMPTRRFDKVAAQLIGLVGAGALILILASPERWITTRTAPQNLPLIEARPAIALVALQVFLWISAAMAEGRIARARRAGESARLNVLILGAGALTLLLLWATNLLRFDLVMIVLLLQQAAGCVVAHVVLYRRRVPLRISAATTTVFATILLVCASVKWALAG